MKTHFLAIVLLASTVALADNLSDNLNSEGSGGTTGGGNNLVRAIDLIPNSITARVVSSYDTDVYIGRRTCFGIFSCRTYAHYFRIRQHWNKQDFIEGKEPLCIFDRWYKYIKKTSPCFPNTSQWDNQEATLYIDGRIAKPGTISKIHTSNIDVLLNQFDVRSADTWRELISYDSFMEQVRNGEYSKYVFTRGLSRLAEAVKKQAKELESAAIASLNQDSSCNFENYKSLNAKIRQFTLGNKLYFAKMRAEGVPFTAEDEKVISDLRSDPFRLIGESVVPICEPQDLQAEGEKLNPLFQELQQE